MLRLAAVTFLPIWSLNVTSTLLSEPSTTRVPATLTFFSSFCGAAAADKGSEQAASKTMERTSFFITVE
jgi:hypothetical protein